MLRKEAGVHTEKERVDKFRTDKIETWDQKRTTRGRGYSYKILEDKKKI